ncbi:MAG TPA: autotransporter-associated beta strand repeat-containing protein, partial [Luteolibacter sp.]
MKPTRCLPFLAPIFYALAAVSASAATYQWDVNATTAGLGGVGTWNTTNAFWDDMSAGANTGTDATIAVTFTNLDTAIFAGTSGIVTLGVPTTVNGLQFNTNGYSIATTGTNTLTLAGAAPTVTLASGANATLNGNIAGTNGLTVAGLARLTLSVASNTFTGGVTVNNGATLQVGGNSGAFNFIVDSNDVAVNGTLQLSRATGVNESINALTGSGSVVTNNTSAVGVTNTLTVGANNGSGTFSGVLANAGDDFLAFTKTGTGTQTLTGANTYTGVTTINGGTLALSGGNNRLGTAGTLSFTG